MLEAAEDSSNIGKQLPLTLIFCKFYFIRSRDPDCDDM